VFGEGNLKKRFGQFLLKTLFRFTFRPSTNSAPSQFVLIFAVLCRNAHFQAEYDGTFGKAPSFAKGFAQAFWAFLRKTKDPRLTTFQYNPLTMLLTVIGCGDAFASGGQFNTCFHLADGGTQLLLDCGATSLVAMQRCGISAAAEIDYIVLSHFHGDHYGGVPFVLLDAMVHKRTRPLTVVSPPGGEGRIGQLMECLYPGLSAKIGMAFPVTYLEFLPEKEIVTPHFRLQAVPVVHSPESLPHAVRLEWNGRKIGFSGDTEWTDNLLAVADGTDLFICECNNYDTESPGHLSYQTLSRHLHRLQTNRLVVTHLGNEMLARRSELEIACLTDVQKLAV
jgi:ribonuclease BN (tRNA processing enzyme)